VLQNQFHLLPSSNFIGAESDNKNITATEQD
jgi:hypothetical protein